MHPHERIIVALDVPTLNDATRYVALLSPYVGYFKVGLELITAVGGPAAVAAVRGAGGKVMYDAKFFDVPRTMAGAARAAVALGADLFTIHASASRDGIRAVVDAVGGDKVVGVSVLTSMSETDCINVYGDSIEDKLSDFVHVLVQSGATWLVCAPKDLRVLDASALRSITPGVRPTWAAADDQRRIETPGRAIALGAELLVIGRPVLHPPPEIGSPVDAVKLVAEEIRVAMTPFEAP